ncbi:isopentenyl-diphosphate delta-isomerase [candidate division WWE3 bacterium RIFOXYC1_FULL_40_10]|uniref:Isopentenyl-diphosphate delta-isomerase n=1 Tax=candidate division WWE3 bacterium RIFOXYA2_FULL_46_9 TaxID=1802636 RepID=A0A1F4W2W6_UNCKA|nr:MAG: isopentenyl-diphosphate delta-isomerase [candidate division WWE3 bacterium RIFOXYB1_FULL_40_22]OGC61721.1 MAG: isopentenyl-diphosphate delta-isomerase [candidate division WWE3 bacterium RIFOXYA1_FULL_40_11]OGC63705.1 MAG: isopentenyl-diphosphate delta-isomerase [candidate division WWE3 bacterium RIFOXYA2_FULL_46_9]OGC64894.1 MAG: isopentenyl-diphosphate delta-isomerase [candidate division WWE3 bacterium RIFOXYB2_FULL_41_6]OGC66104.1 MAG: isopentenyl-diphosphate delta-isomerase [candidat
MVEKVILIDNKNKPLGEMEKMEAHEKGLLHRAFSIFVFNIKGELLIQRRALKKYHCGELWSNTCCGHPRPGEDVIEAAKRRLMEEMGFSCELTPLMEHYYEVELDHNLKEHEITHVFVGNYDLEPNINIDEACDWEWISLEELAEEIEQDPEGFTPWFKQILPKLADYMTTF